MSPLAEIQINGNRRNVVVYENNFYAYIIDSLAVSMVDYSVGSQNLYVTFTNGAIYCYEEVPVTVAMAVMLAESVGNAVTNLVKKEGYHFTRLK